MRCLIIVTLLELGACEQSQHNRVFLGEDHARQALSEALADTADILPADNILIDNKETAIHFAEVVLFKVYGRETIEGERPYEVHKIDGYWIINGTQPKGSKGGTFEIVFNSRDGQIRRVLHYK